MNSVSNLTVNRKVLLDIFLIVEMAAILSLDPIIQTTNGKVRGHRLKTVYGDDFFCFDGIPYAKPPIGELRFKSPQPIESWQGILDCTEVKSKCLQYNRITQKIEGSEDCLYLNMYVKALQTSTPLPVMVYIHGGMYKTGDASRYAWGPDYFMMKDVILITIGFRFGVLGFLKLKDPSLKVPGNCGIKDQMCALKWIKANCAYFNGDANNITVFGHSSGSATTHLLMLSSQCVGLFHKAILMAGYFLDDIEIPDLEYRLAKHLGFDGEKDDEKAILKFLTTVEAEKLANVDILTPLEKEQGYLAPFLPRVESYASEDSIILKSPVEHLQNTWSNKIPIMIGNTSMEALIQYKQFSQDEQLYEIFRKTPERLLPQICQLKCEIGKQRQFAEKLRKLHFGDKKVAIINAYCAIEHESYKSFYHPCHRILLARRAKRQNARTYLYRFDFDSPDFNLYRIKHCGPDIRGVGHVDELSYLFYMPQSFKLSRNSAEFRTVTRMIDLWTNFAATSNPNGHVTAPLTWKHLERNKPEMPNMCLNISKDLSFIHWPEAAKCAVYDSGFLESGVNLY